MPELIKADCLLTLLALAFRLIANCETVCRCYGTEAVIWQGITNTQNAFLTLLRLMLLVRRVSLSRSEQGMMIDRSMQPEIPY